MIPYGKQDINRADIDSVVKILESDFITQGPMVPAFQEAVSAYCGAAYAVAVNSATSALHLACVALGVGKDDIVWTTPITFVASANCAIYCGAKIDFVDIDPNTYNLCVERLAEKLESAYKTGNLPKAVIPVHFCGQSCDMGEVHRLSQKYGFSIIEDASHAIGGKYKGRPIGNCQYSNITVFSFHPVKIITTGEGGMAVTNDEQLADKMALLRSHGITRDLDQMTKEPDGPWYYEQIDLGFNYRMTDIQAALGISQMQRLDQYVTKRQEIAAIYGESLSGLSIVTPLQHSDTYSAFHLYVVRLQLKDKKISHFEVFNGLRNDGIGVNLHYIPVHTQPYYRKLGFRQNDYPEAMSYYRESISLPIYPTLDAMQQKTVIDSLSNLLR